MTEGIWGEEGKESKQEEDITDFIEERIRIICERTKRERNEVLQEYQEIFNDPIVSGDTQLNTIEKRQRYAITVLWARAYLRASSKQFNVIPIAKDKTGVKVFCLIRNDKGEEEIKIISNFMEFENFKVYENVFLSCGDTFCTFYTFNKGDKRNQYLTPKNLHLSESEFLRYIREKYSFEFFPEELREIIINDFYYTPEWFLLKEQTLKRDGYKCKVCGSTEHITAHHIVPRILGGPDTLDNLITLCEDCHKKADRKVKPGWKKLWKKS